MITLDPRIGSKSGGVHDLEEALRNRSLPTTMAQLSYGDVAFTGEGPGGRPVYVGIEIKSLEDCLSCITSGRFAGNQLQGMQETYEIPVLMLVGMYREGPGGELQHPRAGGWSDMQLGNRTWRHNALEHWLHTVKYKGGMQVEKAQTKRDLIAQVHALYSWWSVGSEHHKGHLALPPSNATRVGFSRPSTEQEMLARVPGLGFELSLATVGHFNGSIRKVLAAGEQELLKVPGIGKKLARKIMEVK